MTNVILFDGVCNLCNNSVQFIIKRDPKGHFQFTSLQSEIGKKLISQLGLHNNLSTIVLIENEKVYERSSAALRICRQLNGGWKFFTLFSIVPPAIRDYIYDIIAKNRYKWFGKEESCLLPSPEIRSRFLE